ncbi:hypothetical protein N7494_001563 [Penicillium frequentans]|uniref:Xylanolytic transcriptional activator regulatory domain-containing protein n=1 Tax=Penicillium frequentans TaxID=3151616 RepID=A0AAD6D4F3_9EURO|nr:hypothetical protein N7494_001563 [Penicillium glabrum]
MAVLYGIMALAARLSDEETVRQKADTFFSKAKHLLKMNIDVPCLDNIHASILVGNLCGAEAQSATEGIFFGIAFRMAHILHLPKSNTTEDSITQEIKVRTWWSLYMIDQWSSAGLNLPRQFHDDQHRLPMAEIEFWSLKSGQKVESISRSRPGLWGHMVILARIFGHIQDLHQKLANGLLEEGTAEMITQDLAQKFEHFVQDLPLTLQFTSENLRLHAQMGLGRAFVALHLGYHHYATLLYFPYFDVKASPNVNRTMFAARCKYHATSFSDLLRASQETPDCEAVYLIVAHMTVVSSSALLHTLLFGNQAELLDVKKRLFSNFETLLKLKQYWPGVDLMMERLFTFQKVCMRTMDKTYTVDRWIVKFLLQHALPIEGEIGQLATVELKERGKFASDALSMLRPER